MQGLGYTYENDTASLGILVPFPTLGPHVVQPATLSDKTLTSKLAIPYIPSNRVLADLDISKVVSSSPGPKNPGAVVGGQTNSK